jgi:hypothetical protein
MPRRCAAFSSNAGLNYPARYSVGSSSTVAGKSACACRHHSEAWLGCAQLGPPHAGPCCRIGRRSPVAASLLAASSVVSFSGSVGEALTQKCRECGSLGATAGCSHPQCRTLFHLHCAQMCKVDPGG